MKNSNAVWLNLEVLEDRMALSGAFTGALQAGVPLFTTNNNLLLPSANFGQSQSALPNSSAGFNSQSLNPIAALQAQQQASQAAQIAAIDQFFSDVQSLLQQLNLKTILII